MLQSSKLKTLHELVATASTEELIWMNGYLSGRVAAATGTVITEAPPADTKVAVKRISLAYGTETGNAKRLATQLAAVAKKNGVNAKLIGLDQYRLEDLPKEDNFFVVISTQGEGEPPLPAKKFYDHLLDNELSLKNLRYSVLALGDTAYPLFCKTGEDVDARLEKFGGLRVVPLQKCDVDFEEDANAWFQKVLDTLGQPSAPTTTAPAPVKKATGKKYYHGTIAANINLNDRGSNKQTYHIELRTDEDIAYEPGDTVGIVPRNREEVAERIISLTGVDGNAEVKTAKFTAPVRELLVQHLNICFLLTSTIKKYAAIIGQEIPDTRMDLVDLLRIYPVANAAQFIDALQILMPISPRLYSVASSPAAHGPNEIHITVARDRFLAQDEQRFGLCSEFLGDLSTGSAITFYVHKDKNFKLPAPEKDVIIIGPGTGVAPARSFLAERDALGAAGRNWFFFGEQHFSKDFLYQAEIQNFLGTGVLTKIDLAFSRDQPEKIYVQHRMNEKATELFEWIENGASVFVSGTKDPMSKDVEECLLQIISTHGKRSAEEAKAYLEKMKKENRYEKDVY